MIALNTNIFTCVKVIQNTFFDLIGYYNEADTLECSSILIYFTIKDRFIYKVRLAG
jgi:hypothetical protein